ncbi:TPA: response regulator [Pseudomonas aeruginosa]|nr:response regulator [Pseudomonas aeruginosa]
MSLSIGLIAVVALVYMAILFAIAFYGDRRRTPLSPRLRAWVYSLSLAVYCTSWTFFGAVGQATDQLWSFLPIYLGPVLLMLFAPWVLQKMIMISKQENITSIADFIAARYGKSQALAVVVALICMVGVLPYIALQLKGIVLGVNLLIGSGADSTGTRAQDTALIVSLVLALFTIVFGTRSLDVTEHHRGMVLAIAFESLVKLTAFLAVGIFVTFGLYDGFADLFSQARAAPQLADYWEETVHWPAMLLQTGVAMTAIMCLPRQFHVTVVENIEPRDLNLARWVFPIYLVLAALFVVPIALAGQLHLPAGVMPDSFVISLPLAEAHPALALLAFIGGASAATGMVIVASVALSTMVSNDMLLPWLLRRREKDTERPFEAFRHWLLTVRRVSIAVILLLAYVAYRLLGSSASLATIGQIAFAAIAQLGPAMIGALYWKQANRRGVFAGLAAGSLLWAYTLVLPVVAKGLGWPLERIPGLTWLASNPFGLPIEPLTQGVLISLVGNFALFGLVSVLSRTRVSEHWQASRFIGQEISQRQNSRFMLAVQVEDLLMLAARFVGEERARQSFIRFAYRQGKGFTPNQTANNEWIAHTERLLAGVLGASSARAVVKAAIEGREMQVEDVVRIADEASEVLQFNRALLQGAIENITQGISVVDQSLRLVAWNHRYLELFEYPDGLIYVGRPIADIIRYNADRGLCGPGDPDMHVAKRLYWMRQGTPHTSERLFPNGRVSAERNPFPLNNLYDALGVEFKALAQEQGLHFRLRGSQLRVDSDIKLLRRILQNFLTNAFRYAKGHVLLGVRREDGYLRLEVWDQGPGIPPDKQKVIFEEFKRLDSHQTRAEKGLGLGLAIADRLCKVLGHPLEVRSWPGKGSVFSVRVPLARQAPPALANGHKAEPAQALNGAQVLCVDNEDSILAGMNSLLSRWGCQVWTARSREECATLLDSEMRPQLALIDYHLDDGETGTQLMAWLRTRLGEPVPGVVISADARPELVAEIHAAGLDYLSKPVKPAALRALLSRHLSLR